MLLRAKIENEKELVSIPLKPKIFRSGSKGLYGFGKRELNGKRYQVTIILTEIGTKPK